MIEVPSPERPLAIDRFYMLIGRKEQCAVITRFTYTLNRPAEYGNIVCCGKSFYFRYSILRRLKIDLIGGFRIVTGISRQRALRQQEQLDSFFNSAKDCGLYMRQIRLYIPAERKRICPDDHVNYPLNSFRIMFQHALELRFVELAVNAALLQQFLVRALLRDYAVLDHEDMIGS